MRQYNLAQPFYAQRPISNYYITNLFRLILKSCPHPLSFFQEQMESMLVLLYQYQALRMVDSIQCWNFGGKHFLLHWNSYCHVYLETHWLSLELRTWEGCLKCHCFVLAVKDLQNKQGYIRHIFKFLNKNNTTLNISVRFQKHFIT